MQYEHKSESADYKVDIITCDLKIDLQAKEIKALTDRITSLEKATAELNSIRLVQYKSDVQLDTEEKKKKKLK